MNGSCALTIHLNSSPIGSCLMWKRVTTLALISIELLTLLTNSLKKRTIKRLKERLTRSFVMTS